MSWLFDIMQSHIKLSQCFCIKMSLMQRRSQRRKWSFKCLNDWRIHITYLMKKMKLRTCFTIKVSLVSDQFLYYPDLHKWFSSIAVRKNEIQVTFNSLTPDQICNSLYCQSYNSYNVSSENLVLDQLTTPKLIFFFTLITYLVDIV